MWQRDINRNTPNKMEHEWFDGADISTVKIPNKTLHEAPITEEHATEAHHMKAVRPILAALKK